MGEVASTGVTAVSNILATLFERRSSGGMTNFQKASCTLDASVKLYSYRVDDVWSSSYRVLENLARPDGGASAGDDDESGGTEKRRRRAVGGSGSTLESNPASITQSEQEEGGTMDPLFHKMSKTFDAGGAGGLLLHNLPVQHGACLDLNGDSPLPGLAVDPMVAMQSGADTHLHGSCRLVDCTALRQVVVAACAASPHAPPQTRHSPKEGPAAESAALSALTRMRACPGLDELYGMLTEFAIALRDDAAARAVLHAAGGGQAKRSTRSKKRGQAKSAEAAAGTGGEASPGEGGADSDSDVPLVGGGASPGGANSSGDEGGSGDEGDPLMGLEFDLNLGMTADGWDVMGMVGGGMGRSIPPTPATAGGAGGMLSPMASAAVQRSRRAMERVEGGSDAGGSPPPSWLAADDVDGAAADLDFGPADDGASLGGEDDSDAGIRALLGGGNLALPDATPMHMRGSFGGGGDDGGNTPPSAMSAATKPATGTDAAIAEGRALSSVFASVAAGGAGAATGRGLMGASAGIAAEYSAFDMSKLTTLHSGWAGLGHWKAHKPRAMPKRAAAATEGASREGADDGEEGGGAAASSKGASKSKKAKVSHMIDFSAPPPGKDAFALPARPGTLQLTAASRAEAIALGDKCNIAPLDMLYSLEDLSRTMLYPARVYSAAHELVEGGADHIVEGGDDAGDMYEDGDAELDTWDAHSVGADHGDDHGAPPVGLLSPSALQETKPSFIPDGGLVQAARKVARVEVAHARKAKQVDVKRLKTDIWQHLGRQPQVGAGGYVLEGAPPDADDAASSSAVAAAADTASAAASARGEGQGVSFIHDVVGALGATQPDGVTLPFFFTCVLHLANEKGLLLEGGEGGDLSDIFIRPATKENAL